MIPATLLVVAKAPVPGLAKTRLAAAVGADVAADIAAAALLDTLDAVAATAVRRRVVALTGRLDGARAAAELAARLDGFTVIPQRGEDFAARLANAHLDASEGGPVVQIGMDTPQVSADLLTRCARRLRGGDAVLGMADDGGWWLLGVTDPVAADCLRAVPMSRPDTGARTLAALRDRGFDVRLVQRLADVDTLEDVDAVRRACRPDSRFARAARLLPVRQDQVVEQQRADDVDGQPPPL
ncbi:TIGR04282 family arsenosugar biosynthesis glycosyltransferase [Mycolicibacterium sp. XJ1819]